MRFKTGDVVIDRPSWWLYDADNQVVAWAGDMFASLAEAQTAAEFFQFGASRLRFEHYLDRTGQWRWRALDGDCKIASSTMTYPTELAARRAAHLVKTTVAHAVPASARVTALRRTAD